MSFDFDPSQWVGLAARYPILLVMIGGFLLGSCFTQAVKKTWLAWGNTALINKKRYQNSCQWLAVLSTYWATEMIWRVVMLENGHGLKRITSISVAFVCPVFYAGLVALLRMRWPLLAEQFGDNGTFEKELPPSSP